MGRFRGLRDERNSGDDQHSDAASGDSGVDKHRDAASGDSGVDKLRNDGASGDDKLDPRGDGDSSNYYTEESEGPAQRDDEYYYDMMPPQYAVAKDCTCRPG